MKNTTHIIPPLFGASPSTLRHRARIILLAAAMLPILLSAQNSAFAGSATWLASPATGNWNTATNWTPTTVPNGDSDIATFEMSNTTGVVLSADTTVAEIVFDAGASAYTINLSAYGLSINEAINNNSGVTQTFDLPSFGCINGSVFFHNSATAGSATTFILEGGPGCPPPFSKGGSFIFFFDSSSADQATFVCNGGTRKANNLGGSFILFFGTSSAGSAMFITNPSESNFSDGGSIHFSESSTAANAIFINNGGRDRRAGHGSTAFEDNSDAGNATLIANGGDGAIGGRILFSQGASGGRARVEVFGNGNFGNHDFVNGFLDISGHTGPLVTIGSIEGNGRVTLGARTLRVGSNNLNTTFSGVISDGGVGGGTGGSLTKVGTGKLVLARANTYTGGTIIKDGKLVVNNVGGSGTGSGAVQVIVGTLGGTGIIAGAVTVGTGSGPRANLSPSVLTIQSPLTFNSNANYNFLLNTRTATSDKVVALGVTINSGALFVFTDVGSGTLTSGTVFTVIDNTSANPIAGTFSNLPDNSTFTSNGNTYQVSYEGGDGNDLTLTVVP